MWISQPFVSSTYPLLHFTAKSCPTSSLLGHSKTFFSLGTLRNPWMKLNSLNLFTLQAQSDIDEAMDDGGGGGGSGGGGGGRAGSVESTGKGDSRKKGGVGKGKGPRGAGGSGTGSGGGSTGGGGGGGKHKFWS